VIGHNVLDGGTDAQDGNNYPGPNLQEYAAAVVGAAGPQTLLGAARNRTLKRFTDTVGFSAANSGTAATVSIDAASPFGRPAYKIVMPAGNTWHEVQFTGFNIAQFDGHVAFRLWVDDYTTLNEVRVYAGNSGYAKLYEQRNLVATSGEWRYNGEIVMFAGPMANSNGSGFVSGVDTLSDFKLRIFPSAAGTTVWVDACFVPGVGRATHIITHDDASVTWLENVLPELSSNRLTATFCINTGDLGTNPSLYLSNSQVQQIAAAGHQISAHNVSNTAYADGTGLGTQNAATYTADWRTSQYALSALIGTRLDTTYHAYVQGRNNTALHATMIAAGMRMARSTSIGYNLPQLGLGNGVLALKTQHLHLLTTAQIDAICDNAEAYGATVVWMVHEVTDAGGVGVETAKSVYRHLCRTINGRASAGRCVHKTASDFAREAYSERLVAAALLP